MSEPAQHDDVIGIVAYLRESIADFDAAIRDLLVKRNGLAARLAALDASSDQAVHEAAADYERRVRERRPYEGAEDAGDLIAEAYRRYVR